MAYVHQTEVGRYRVTDGGCRDVRRLKDGTPALAAEELARLELRAAITVLTTSITSAVRSCASRVRRWGSGRWISPSTSA